MPNHKFLGLIGCIFLGLMLVAINPVSAGNLQNVPLGGDVIVGEQGLVIPVPAGSVLSWYTSPQTVGVSAPAATITVANPNNFYVAPSTFNSHLGPWYIRNTNVLVFFVEREDVTVVEVFDQQTGQRGGILNVSAGDFLTFAVYSDLPYIAGQRNDKKATVTLKVQGPDKTFYSSLKQDAITSIPLVNQPVPGPDQNTYPYFWNSIPSVKNSKKGWATGMLDNTGKRIYKDGYYQIWLEYTLNGAKYGGAISTVKILSTSPVQTTGSISVSSSPPGAKIFLDGKDMGFSTPNTLNGISVGSHNIQCRKSGYSDSSQNVMVNAGQTANVVSTLSPIHIVTPVKPLVGLISVSSVPSGAEIYLDGSDKGSTPRTLNGIPVGIHTVRCSKNGYLDSSQNVTLNAGQTASVLVTLSSNQIVTPVKPLAGSISVTSSPSGAEIYLDGTDKGTTPSTLKGISAGNHILLLKKTGYRDYQTSIKVSSLQTTSVSAILQRSLVITPVKFL